MSVDPKTSAFRLRTLKTSLARAGAVFVAALAPVTFGILTIIFGLIGWSQQLFNGTFHSVFSVILRSLGDFALSPKNFEEGNAFTDVSSVCGILTLYSSFAVIIASVFREQRRKLLARHVLRKHHLVIGDTALAKRVGAIWARTDRRTLRVAPSDAPTPEFLQRVVRHSYDERLATVFAMRRARRVFLDLGDDALTVALALKVLSVLAGGRPRRRSSASLREWICVIQDNRFADYFLSEVRAIRSRLDQGIDLPQIVLLQPEQLVADDLLAASAWGRAGSCAPPHALVIGYGFLGRHVVEGLLRWIPTEHSRTLVTVLTPQSEDHAKRLSARRQAADGRFDVSFLDLAALEDLARSETSGNSPLADRDAAAPVTVVFLTSDRLHDNILSYIFIQAIRARLGRLTCKVFSRQGDGEDISTLLPMSLIVSKAPGLTTVGLSDERLGAYLLTPERIAFDDVSAKPVDFAGAEPS